MILKHNLGITWVAHGLKGLTLHKTGLAGPWTVYIFGLPDNCIKPLSRFIVLLRTKQGHTCGIIGTFIPGVFGEKMDKPFELHLGRSKIFLIKKSLGIVKLHVCRNKKSGAVIGKCVGI